MLRIQAAGAHSRLPQTFPIFFECLGAPGSSAHRQVSGLDEKLPIS